MRAVLALRFEGHWGLLNCKKKKKNLPQFHFSGGPINLRTPTQKHTHTHTKQDKQARTLNTHIDYILMQTFANLHTIKEQTL